jgi:hypothetical protein
MMGSKHELLTCSAFPESSQQRSSPALVATHPVRELKADKTEAGQTVDEPMVEG